MISISAAILALIIGVMLVPVARKRPSYMAGLDGFMLVAVGGVLAMGLLPYSFETAGWPAAGALLLGMALPMLLERGHHHNERTHDSWLSVDVGAWSIRTRISGWRCTGHPAISTPFAEPWKWACCCTDFRWV